MSVHHDPSLPRRVRRGLQVTLLSSVAIVAACSGDSTTSPSTSAFLRGTSSDHEIGLVLNSVGQNLTLFQLGSPDSIRQIPLGTSNTITATDFSVSGTNVAIPLGDAASVAFINLNAGMTIQRYFIFGSGNATGSAFVNDSTVIAANTLGGYVGRFTAGQKSDTIGDTVTVTPQPTVVVMAGSRALIVSANEDENYVPLGNGVVTAINPATMAVLGTVHTGGTNSTAAALGPDGLLYVLNTGDYVTQGSMTIVDPAMVQAPTTIPNMGVGPGDISIDANGLAYISSFSYGTIVWNTRTQQFVRDATNPICAPLAGGGCRTASSAVTDAAGDLYQTFFGSNTDIPQIFIYHAGTFALTDSIALGAGSGPTSVGIHTF